MSNQLKHAIRQLFSYKGIIGSVTEKAILNASKTGIKTEINANNSEDSISRLHYFTIGHTFKQLYPSIIFSPQLQENGEMRATRFLSLQKETFPASALVRLLQDIRNINSHYIHTLHRVHLRNIDADCKQFIQESFHLGVIFSLYRLRLQAKQSKNKNKNNVNRILKEEREQLLTECIENEQQLITHIREMFYQSLYKNNNKLNDDQQKLKNYLDSNLHTVNDWLHYILFFNVTNQNSHYQLENKIGGTQEHHNVFSIEEGTYLSLEACLFICSMFLYKNEAQKLIPKIKGFKKNKDKQDQSKRNLFTGFAKKFSSQDINSEQKDLVQFRDLILYLNKFPLVWNKSLEEQDKHTTKLNQHLDKRLVDLEIENQFNKTVEKRFKIKDWEQFKAFAIDYIFGKPDIFKAKQNKKYFDFITKNDEVRKIICAIENNQFVKSEYKAKNDFKRYALEYVIKNYYPRDNRYSEFKNNRFYSKKDREKFEKELNQNKSIEKLRNRVSEKQFINSYARNTDYFIQFATRYLAEKQYFGQETSFRMYQFYDGFAQNAFLTAKKNEFTKKQFDKLKFHKGKLVHYSTYQEHLLRYPNWNTPFVEQNNAIQIKLKGINEPICLQRNILIYFLQDALYCNQPLKNRGQVILRAYISKLNELHWKK